MGCGNAHLKQITVVVHNDGAVRPPGAMLLTGDLVSGWLRWIERFQFYMLAIEKSTRHGTVQVAMLPNLMGREAINIFRMFGWENAVDKYDFDKVITKIAAYFATRRNVTYEWYKFMKHIQKVKLSILSSRT